MLKVAKLTGIFRHALSIFKLIDSAIFERSYFTTLKIKHLGFLLLGLFNFVCVVAQESINASGANAAAASGSISYSIGQVVYSSAVGSNGSVNQGVQQPFEIEIITGIEHAEIDIVVFPNPALEQLQLKISSNNTENYSLQLIDAQGKVVLLNNQIQPITTIPFGEFISGIYFLSVYEHTTLLKTYRVVRP
ncbi:MAG: hypothetical protein RLZZ543_1994 [Bacteroidota bacterium]